MARKPGKRIDYLTLDVDGMYYKVELRACTGIYSEEFYLCMDDPQMDLNGTDLKVLKQKAAEFIRSQCAVAWESWICIYFNDPEHYRSGPNHHNYEVQITWHRLEQGISHSGRKVHREPSQKYSHNGWPSEDDRGSRSTYVRETPELVAGLEEIGRRIEELRKRLSTLLSPKQIESTVEKLLDGVRAMLPMGKGK